MFWTWKYKNQEMVSWGRPRSIPAEEVSDLKEDYKVKVYSGEDIHPGERVLYAMQGDATLGMGDSIWLINYIRDIYKVKGHRRCSFDVATSDTMATFYSSFLPGAINFIDEYVTKEEFDKYDHVLPAMYYWKEVDDADRSWVDNKSILERLYGLVGIEYRGLSDWTDFTPDEILDPPDDFYSRLGITKGEKYCFFQWHSSGLPKNLPPASNIKLLKHITETYDVKCYVIGRLKKLDSIEKIPGVVNLSNKTSANDVFSLAINADFILAPDSAGVHLGEAYHIPTVGIMSTLPPSYIASKYKIPAFMFGSGFCSHKPCGIVTKLPIDTKCPPGTKDWCAVLRLIDLNMFDKCLARSIKNRKDYRHCEAIDFYKSQQLPIVLN